MLRDVNLKRVDIDAGHESVGRSFAATNVQPSDRRLAEARCDELGTRRRNYGSRDRESLRRSTLCKYPVLFFAQ